MEAQLGQVAGVPGARSRLTPRQRARLLAAFSEFIQGDPDGSILHVGLRGQLADQALTLGSSLGNPVVVSAIDVRAAERGRFARGDGRQLLYADGEFDWVYCENLLDHAGSFERQFELLKELNRVAKKGVFLSAANRRHPLDQESRLPLLHWLPAALWQRLAPGAAQGRSLLTVQGLKRLVSLLPGQPQSDIGHIRLFGPKAVFFLMVKKS